MDTLSLRGDKMKLEVRAMMKDTATASAKCIYLMQGSNRSSRSVSAVPLLALYQNNKDASNPSHTPQRPYSADSLRKLDVVPDRVFFKQVKGNGIRKLISSSRRLHNTDDFELDSISSLPSSELLKSLVDETVTPRANSALTSDYTESILDLNENIDSAHLDSSRDIMRHGKHPTKRQTKTAAKAAQMRRKSRDVEESTQESTQSTAVETLSPTSDQPMSLPANLLPGLRSKPPRPRAVSKATSSGTMRHQSTATEDIAGTSQTAVRTSPTQVNLHKVKAGEQNRSDSSDVQLHEKIHRQPAYQLMCAGPSCSKIMERDIDELFADAERAMESVDSANVDYDDRVPALIHDFNMQNRGEHKRKADRQFRRPVSKVNYGSKLYNTSSDSTSSPQSTSGQDRSEKVTSIPEPFRYLDSSSQHTSLRDSQIATTGSESKVPIRARETQESRSSTSSSNSPSASDSSTSTESSTRTTVANKPAMDIIMKESITPRPVDSTGELEAMIRSLEDEYMKQQQIIDSFHHSLPIVLQAEMDSEESEKDMIIMEVTSTETDESMPEADTIKDSSSQIGSCQQSKLTEEIANDPSITEPRYEAILEYLSGVDGKSLKDEQSFIDKSRKRVLVTGTSKPGDLARYSQMELAEELIAMHSAISEKSATIRMLEDALDDHRGSLSEAQERAKQQLVAKFKRIKTDSDAAITRHQHLIKELMVDKSSLQTNYQILLDQLNMMRERHENNTKALEHRYEAELKKALGMQIANEKTRRDRWVESRTQKIKELSIKSIQPEIQAINERYEHDMNEMRALHKRELQAVEESNARKTQMQIDAIREQFIKERECMMVADHEHMRERYEAMLKSEEEAFTAHRKRLLQDHGARLAECEAREQEVCSERDRCIAAVKEECAQKLRSAEERYEHEMNMLKETAKYECQKWKANFLKENEAAMAKKQEDIYLNAKKERNEEIESVITRLENEMHRAKMELTAAEETRVKRLTEKYESEIKDLEATALEYQAKLNNVKIKEREAEERIASLQSTIIHLKTQLTIAFDKHEKFVTEKESEKVLNQEVYTKMLQLQEEVERSNRERQEELRVLFTRVKTTVQHKEVMIAELNNNYAALKDKCNFLKTTLDKQRKNRYIQ